MTAGQTFSGAYHYLKDWHPRFGDNTQIFSQFDAGGQLMKASTRSYRELDNVDGDN